MRRPTTSVPDLQQLRARMRRLERPTARVVHAPHPTAGGLPPLTAGCSYEVTDMGLALAMLAGPSAAGDWCAVVGAPDFGAEAAAGLGVDLARTVLVPEPGEQWLEVVAALVDTVPVVLLRPGGRVTPSASARLGARLRTRGAVLLVHAAAGSWPRSELRLSATTHTWDGVGEGHGRLRSRRLTVQVRRGVAPPQLLELRLPGDVPGDTLRPQPLGKPTSPAPDVLAPDRLVPEAG